MGSTRYHKRGRNNLNRNRITSTKGVGLPDVLWQKFRYAEQNFRFSLGTVDLLNQYNMSLSNPYDPYFSTGGKSALYFQQVFSNYKFARVYGASIRVRITDTNSANTIPMCIAIVVSSSYNSDTGTLGPDDILALPRNRCKIMKLFPSRIGGTRILKAFWHMSDIHYFTRQQYDSLLPSNQFDVTNSGGFADPTYDAFANVYYFKMVDDTVAVEAVGEISITFYTKMWCKQPFTQPGDDHVNNEPGTGMPIEPEEEDLEPPAEPPFWEEINAYDRMDNYNDLVMNDPE